MPTPDAAADSTGGDTLLGRRLAGRYRIVERIGHGGMAAVYRATDERLGRDVALKIFHHGLTSPQDLQRQHSEVRHFARLTHPCLVGLHDAISDEEGRSVLVLEYVAGHDLRQRLADGPMSAAAVARIGADVAHGLAYIHSQDVIHRDVSPGNILLPANTSNGVAAKLTDLGVARVIDGSRITTTGTLIGTAAYLSPEQARGSALTPASDIYSLGLVLLECLTGQRAFQGPAVESAVARLSRDPEIPDQLSANWRDLLTTMTAREPTERPTAAEVARALAGLTDEASTTPLTVRVPPPIDPATTQRMEQPSPEDDVTMRFPLAGGSLHDSPLFQQFRRLDTRTVFAAAAAILIAILVLVVALPGHQQSPAPAPKYPTVPGQLGTHLKQLERDVSPQSNP